MAYHLEGRLLEVCNCRVLCPCWIGEDPDFGTCDTIVAWHFDKGTVDGVDVSGHTIAMIAHVPGNILQGNWTRRRLPRRQGFPAQEQAIARRLYRSKGRAGRGAREAGRQGRFGRESTADVRRSAAVAGRSRSATPAMPSSSHTRVQAAPTTDAHGHGVLHRARRAGIRRKSAALPVEERLGRHRPRHQGPQRAAKHVRVRRVINRGKARSDGASFAPHLPK